MNENVAPSNRDFQTK